ncbi:MAG: cytochrome d ubiquinol oxidase subunit II [Rubrobacteraceae bacterium]
MLEVAVAGAMALALLIFALAGGADFGGGMWTFVASRERAGREMQLVDRAIGPIWEANELWIVVAMVIMWSGFPSVFAVYGISLFVPLVFVLVGIVLRGGLFALQEHAEFSHVRQAFVVFGRAFGAVSVIAPFFFGLAAGTIASGRLRFERQQEDAGFAVGRPVGGYFESWFGPFPIMVGFLAVVICLYLSATYLTLEAEDMPDLRDSYRRRGIATGAVLGLLGVAALPVMSFDAPYLWRGVLQFPAIAVLIAAALALISSLALLYTRRYWWARTAAITHVVGVFLVWAAAQYPYLLVPDITISSAAAPSSVLVALLVLSFFYAAVLGPSLALLLYIFKRHPSRVEDPARTEAEGE